MDHNSLDITHLVRWPLKDILSITMLSLEIQVTVNFQQITNMSIEYVHTLYKVILDCLYYTLCRKLVSDSRNDKWVLKTNYFFYFFIQVYHTQGSGNVVGYTKVTKVMSDKMTTLSVHEHYDRVHICLVKSMI